MKKQTITIVIPAYNEAARLGDCLDAIQNQTVTPDEILVVDNNSSDATRAIASLYQNVRVIHESKQGIAHARNRGFNEAKSDLIARIDADTELSPYWVEQVLEYYQHGKGALTGSCYFKNVPMREVTRRITNFFVYRYGSVATGYYPLWGSNMVIDRTSWQKISSQACLDNDLHEDLDLAWHCHASKIDITYMPSLTVTIEMRAGFSSPSQTWRYLMMWPRTIRKHNRLVWLPAMLGASFLFIFSWVPKYAGRVGREAKRHLRFAADYFDR